MKAGVAAMRLTQHVPCKVPIRPDLFHDLVEPDVGCLQCLVEHVHLNLRMVVWLKTLSGAKPFQTSSRKWRSKENSRSPKVRNNPVVVCVDQALRLDPITENYDA